MTPRLYLIGVVAVVLVAVSNAFRVASGLKAAGLRSRLSMSAKAKKTVVVTGLGVVSSVGSGASNFFDNLCKGKCGISKVDRFDASPFKCQIAGQIRDFDPKEYYASKKKIKQNDLSCHYAVAASRMAIADAGLDFSVSDPNRAGVIIGSAFGGMQSFEEAVLDLAKSGPGAVGSYTIPMILGNTAPGVVAMETGAKGPNFGVQTACATATHAFGEALRHLRNGDADVMIAGGTEAPLTPLSFAGFCNLVAMNTNCNDNPTLASRPFDLNRAGFVMSEGAGVLVLETLDHAVQRGARVYCELAGYGASCDAYHITSPDPEGQGLKRSILACLNDGDISPDDVQYINAHGTSTKKNDLFETMAFKSTFGEHARRLKISSIKGSTGHSLGAAGGLEAIACVKALEQQVVPPTINYQTPDPECDLDYVPNHAQRVQGLRVALSDNLGFGGHNGVVAFRAIQ